MAQVDIKRVEKIYTEAVMAGDWQRELEALAGLRLLFSQEGDRKKEARKYNELWKVALEKVLRERGKRLEREQLQTYLKDLRSAYKYASEYDFRSFLIFMEWERKPQDKFYHPRRKVLKEAIDCLQSLEDGELDILGLSFPPRAGKEQPLSSKILTPSGWTTMGEIKVGSLVIGADGKPCLVTNVFPQGVKDVYTVTFDDETKVDCGLEHLWTVQTRDDRKRGKKRTITTKEMMKNLYVENGKRKNYSVQYVQPVEFENNLFNTDIHPYVLGVILGDGHISGGIEITNPENEIIQRVSSLLPEEDQIQLKCKNSDITYSITKKDRKIKTEKGFGVPCKTATKIREYGLSNKRAEAKFIPTKYLFSSIENRIELLRGLMDTDGYCSSEKNSYCEYTTVSIELAKGFIELVRSLGGRASLSSKIGHYTKNEERIYCQTAYRIAFNLEINPFFVERKAQNFISRTKRASKYIKSIEYNRKEECQCIMVDNKDHLYVTDEYNVTHNSTLGLLYILWVSGRHPEKSVFGSGHSTALMKSFYDGELDFSTSGIYNYKEIFPQSQVCDTDAKGNMIDLGTPKRYKTITFASIDTAMSGRIEATSLLYVDDLIADIEEARKPERLLNAYMKYETDIKQRRKDKVPLLMIGTRWSLNDPIGVEERDNADNPRAKFISIPALNEDGESNFEYEYGVGFSKEYYQDRKRMLDAIDPAIFMCVYQQQPIESEGVCFNHSSLKFYNGELPTEGYVGTYLFGDCAWGGGDSFSAPIGAVYIIGDEKRVYVKDWLFTREPRNVTLKLNVMSIIKNGVQRARYEANNGGDAFAADVDKELKRMGYHVEITWEKASNTQSKVDKILQNAPAIKEHFYFLADAYRSQQYRAAILELTSWLVTGKSPHDDAPDGLTGLAVLTLGKLKASITTLRSRYGL